jgi:hypothetical protein
MSEQHIGVAVRQRIAIARAPEDTMTSPYLDRIRSPRRIIEELIVVRGIELGKTSAVAQRQRIERDLTFLNDELARIDGRRVESAGSATDGELLRDERPRP